MKSRKHSSRNTESRAGTSFAGPVGKRSLVQRRYGTGRAAQKTRTVQRKATGDESRVREVAAVGVNGGGGSLPHQQTIQQSFGGHDLSGVKSHVGGDAAAACAGIGANAYATGNDVAFAASPDLHTAAHEAAHVVQQRAGVQLSGGVGQVGDAYETHADAVADAVVAGQSAEALLGDSSGVAGAVQRKPVQRRASAERVVQRDGEGDESWADAAWNRGVAVGTAIGDAVGDAIDTVTGAAQTAEEQLREAYQQGSEALERKLHELSIDDLTSALPSVQEIAQYIVDTYWPTDTGWTASAALMAGGTLAGTDAAIPCDISLEAGAGLSASVFRKGTTIELGVTGTENAQGELKFSVKAAKLPLGERLEGVEAFKLTTDLARINWPRRALSMLLAGNVRGCFDALCDTAVSVGDNTQLEVRLAPGASLYLKGELGLNSLVKAGLTAGQKAGLEVTFANPTESMNGKVEFKGEVGLFAGAELDFAEDLPSIGGVLQPLITALARTAVDGEVAGGLRVTYTIPKTMPDTVAAAGSSAIEVAVYGRQKSSAALLGQSGEVEALAEVILALPDVAGFVAALEGNAVDGDDVAGLIPFSKLRGEIGGKLRIRDLMEIFPRLESLMPSLEDANTLEASFKLKLEVTKAEMLRIAQRSVVGVAETVRLLLSGDIKGAIANQVDAATENIADFVGMIKGLEAEVQTGSVEQIAARTPGEGDVTGVRGSGSVSLMGVHKYEWTPQQLGLDRLQVFLRGLI